MFQPNYMYLCNSYSIICTLEIAHLHRLYDYNNNYNNNNDKRE